jgi:DNA-binding transcriptional LysR family regulator
MPLPSIRALETFDAVAETGSFRAAADRLGVSPSAVSKSMADLEARLGTNLMNRTTRQLTLTEAGVAYHAFVATALATLGEGAETLHAVTAVPRGTVRVAMPVNFGLIFVSPLLRKFIARYPDVRVDTVLSDGYIDPVGDGFDVVIRAATQLPDSTLVARKILETPIAVCASPEYVERCGTPSHPDDLSGHDCLPLTNATLLANWTFDIAGTLRTVRVDGPIRSTSIMLVREAALDGMGIARVPFHVVASDIEAGRLVRLLPDFERTEGAVFLLYPAQRALALKTRVFIDFLAGELASVRA